MSKKTSDEMTYTPSNVTKRGSVYDRQHFEARLSCIATYNIRSSSSSRDLLDAGKTQQNTNMK